MGKKTMKIIIKNKEKYNELTGSKKKKGDTANHLPEEVDILVKHECIELTPLQAKLLEKKKLKKETNKTELTGEVEELLKDKNLMKKLKQEVSKNVAGEEDTIHTIGLNACGRLVENAAKTSYNCIPNDESGTGKDYTTEKTLKVFVPKDDLIIRTRISPAVLNYWHNAKFEPEWSWNGKVLYLKDVSDNILNAEVMKTFTSDQTTATIIINQMACDLETQGKPCVFCTTAFGTPGQEQLRRFSLIPLDSSEEQTKRIKNFHAEKAVIGITPKKNRVIEQAMLALDRVKVNIPYAKTLADRFPNNIIVRTVFGSFIDLIKASAALHQFQRETDENGFILANLDDYENARIALIKTASNSELIPISKNQKRIIDTIDKELDKNIDEQKSIGGGSHSFWSGKEIAEKVTFISEYTNIWKNLNILASYGFLEKGEKEIENYSTSDGDNSRTYSKLVSAFRIKERQDFTLPTKEEMEVELK